MSGKSFPAQAQFVVELIAGGNTALKFFFYRFNQFFYNFSNYIEGNTFVAKQSAIT